MKTILTFAALFFLTISLSFAQDARYQNVMKKEIEKVISSDSISHLQESANSFARVSELFPNEWQPFYYSALAYTFQGLNNTLTMDKRDLALDKANELVAKAANLSPNNAEIVTLQGFILMAKLNVDPASRGQSMSGKVMSTYGMALGIDSKNPRALALLAQMEYGMAKFFGSGTEKSCGIAKQSLAIFETQDEAARKEAILPTWGKNLASGLVKKCN